MKAVAAQQVAVSSSLTERFVVGCFVLALGSAIACSNHSVAGRRQAAILLSELQDKGIKVGDAAQKRSAKFTVWCEDCSRNFVIRTGTDDGVD